jgi:hypothetical protein
MTTGSTELVKYDAMCQAIDKAYAVDEVKEIHDRAAALEAYFRQAKNPQPERKACEIRLRAERKAGKLLAKMQKHPGKRNDLAQGLPQVSEYKQALQDTQISKETATRWQQLAGVPQDDFEAALAGPEKPTTNAILAKRRPKQEGMNPKALWLWGRLRDFERDMFDADQKFLLSQMTEGMRKDVQRLTPLVIKWLKGV